MDRLANTSGPPERSSGYPRNVTRGKTSPTNSDCARTCGEAVNSTRIASIKPSLRIGYLHFPTTRSLHDNGPNHSVLTVIGNETGKFKLTRFGERPQQLGGAGNGHPLRVWI